MKDIPDDVWRYLTLKVRVTLDELKANMTEAITSALITIKEESEEWGGK